MGNQNRKKLLEMRDISKAFPGVQALDHVGLDLYEGETHVLLGENGAGKSTLIKILTGAYRADAGEIFIDGNRVEISEPRKGIALGISCIYQEYNLNPFTPVYENIFLGRELTKRFKLIDFKTTVKETNKILERMGLSISPTVLVKHLGVAQKQLVEIAKAISMNARIIIFDEPTSALSEDEIKTLFQIIRDLKKQNYGIIYISHRLEEIMQIGDRYSVLRDGKMIGGGNVQQWALGEVVKMMVGREVLYLKRTESYVSEEEVLRVDGLCYKDQVRGVSFGLRKGEILGVAGLMGAGRTELAKCIIGEYRKEEGKIYLNGKEAQLGSVSASFAYSEVLTNCSPATLETSIGLSETRSTTSTFSSSESLQLFSSVQVTAGITSKADYKTNTGQEVEVKGVGKQTYSQEVSFGVEATFSASFSTSNTYTTQNTWTEEVQQSREISRTRTITVPPYTKLEIYDILKSIDNVTVPFTQVLRVRSKDRRNNGLPLSGPEIVTQLFSNLVTSAIKKVGEDFVDVTIRGNVKINRVLNAYTTVLGDSTGCR